MNFKISFARTWGAFFSCPLHHFALILISIKDILNISTYQSLLFPGMLTRDNPCLDTALSVFRHLYHTKVADPVWPRGFQQV
jgi:hypothetical protein